MKSTNFLKTIHKNAGGDLEKIFSTEDIQIQLDIVKTLYLSFTKNDVFLIERILKLYITEDKNSKLQGCSLITKACCIMLFKLQNVEHSLLIWEAKNSNTDTFASIDVQYMMGGGVKETLAFLEKKNNVAYEYAKKCFDLGELSKSNIEEMKWSISNFEDELYEN